MSKFKVPATTLQRFITLTDLKLEINNGRSYIIGTDGYIACVEYLGESDQSDESCYIKPDVDKVNKEANFDGTFTFDTIPELAMGSVSTTSGQECSEFIIWPDSSPLDKWREWFKVSEQPDGAMYCNITQIEALWRCSPTGELVFPEVINANEPTIVRDINDANWLGVFIPTTDEKKYVKPATLPEWL